jgi:hypothetical protein
MLSSPATPSAAGRGDLRGGLRQGIAEPGFTAADLNGNRGHQSVAEGAGIIVKMATTAQTARPARRA